MAETTERMTLKLTEDRETLVRLACAMGAAATPSCMRRDPAAAVELLSSLAAALVDPDGMSVAEAVANGMCFSLDAHLQCRDERCDHKATAEVLRSVLRAAGEERER